MINKINWGDIPTWLAAIGTISTFIIYYFLLRVEISKRDEERELQKQYTQRRISAWVDNNIVFIKNGGIEPVYHAVVHVGPMGTKFEVDSGKHIEIVLGNIGPGQQIEEPVMERFLKGEIFPIIPEVAIEFTDCEGKYWRRESNGNLSQVKHRRPYD